MKILFQGDSITDAERDREDDNNVGIGYPVLVKADLGFNSPGKYEFINRGISGNRIVDVYTRIKSDIINIKPDVMSILIGVNDVWHELAREDGVDADKYFKIYDMLIEEVKNALPDIKIMIMEPFLIPVEDKLYFREDLYKKIEICRKLAREFADVYLPTDGLLCAAFIGDEPTSYAADGVHPTDKGAEFIGGLYCQYMKKIIDSLL